MTEALIILNILILELVLSIDNAAVLATLVKRLPLHQQKKALTYGIVGAYVFRGLALVFASLLIKIAWLKVVGGLYLIYLAFKAIRGSEGDDSAFNFKFSFLSTFWATVVSVEIMDLVFSIDNVFAVVAFTENIWLIMAGVAVGILSIRFAANKFIKLLDTNPILEKIAYYVIGGLGIRLVASYWLTGLNTESVDIAFSVATLLAFTIPVIFNRKKS